MTQASKHFNRLIKYPETRAFSYCGQRCLIVAVSSVASNATAALATAATVVTAAAELQLLLLLLFLPLLLLLVTGHDDLDELKSE